MKTRRARSNAPIVSRFSGFKRIITALINDVAEDGATAYAPHLAARPGGDREDGAVEA